MTIIRKELADKILVAYRMNFVNNLDFILLQICEIDPWLKRHRKKIQVIDIYNNRVRKDCIYNGRIYYIRITLEKVYEKIII